MRKPYLLFFLLTLLCVIRSAHAQDARWGYMLYFDGTNDYATANSISGDLTGSHWTIECWFRSTRSVSYAETVFAFNPADGTNRIEIGVGSSSGNKVYIYTSNSSPGTLYGTTTITPNTWYHMTVTFNATTRAINLYLNGNATAEVSRTTPVADVIQSTDKFSLGQEWDGVNASGFFQGNIDEFRVWNHIRPTADINTDRYRQIATNATGLQAYFRMTNNTGTSVTDNSGNSNTVTLVNGTAWQTSSAPKPTNGTGSSSQTICSGSQPAGISLSTLQYSNLQWQWSDDLSVWNNISGATASPLTSAQMGSLTGTRYFRARLDNGYSTAYDYSDNNVTATVVTEGPGTITISNGSSSASGWCLSDGVLISNMDVTVNIGVITNALEAGDLEIRAGTDIILDENIQPALSAAHTLTCKAARDIFITPGRTIQPFSGALNIVLWADKDASSGGMIFARANSTIATNGGHLWMGGGSGTATWNGLTTGNSYAEAGSQIGTALTGHYQVQGLNAVTQTYRNGITLDQVAITTSGGDLSLWGRSDGQASANAAIGVHILRGTTINTGSGDLTINAVTQNGASTILNWFWGLLLASDRTAEPVVLQTTSGAITINGDASRTNDGRHTGGIGLFEWTADGPGKVEIKTVSGDIALHGRHLDNFTTNTQGGIAAGNSYNTKSIVSQTGNITITGESNSSTINGITFTQATQIGYDGVNPCSGNITVRSNRLAAFHADTRFQSTGSLTIEPVTASNTIGIAGGTGTLSLPAGYFSTQFVSGFSSVTVGNSNSGTVTTGNASTTFSDHTLLQGASVSIGSGTSFSIIKNLSLVAHNGDITSSAAHTISKTSGADATLTLQSTGRISLTGASISASTNKLNILLQTDKNGVNQTGSTSASTGVYLDGGTISSNGGTITMAGGADPATGYAVGYGTSTYTPQQYGVRLDNNATLNAGGGSIFLRGRTASTTTSDGICIGCNSGGATVNAGSGGTVTLTGDAYSAGSYYGVAIGGAGATSVDGTTININGTAATGFNPVRFYQSAVIGGTHGQFIRFNSYYTGSSGSGWSVIHGTFNNSNPVTIGNTTHTTLIEYTVDRSGTTGAYGAVHSFANALVLQGNNATLRIQPGANHLSRNQVIGAGSESGSNWTLQLATAQSNSNLSGWLPALQNATGFSVMELGRDDGSGATTVYYPTTALNQPVILKAGSGGMTISNASGSTAFNTGTGNLTLHAAGNIAIQNGVSTSGRLVIRPAASATVSENANGAIAANELLLATSTAVYNLNTGSNNAATIAGNAGSINYTDNDALIIGSVNGTTGISASGTIRIATLSGNLTLAEDITTADNSAMAILLLADQNKAAGDATGGNIIISGSPAVSTGTGGTARLYSGAIMASTGLQDFVGTGNVRINVDQNTVSFTPALGAGNYALFRVASTLPVSLISFTAQCRGNDVLLQWSTASEQHNRHFVIERSGNGLQWTNAGLVQGYGNSNTVRTYQFSEAYNSNAAYYRLKQVDNDGRATLSNVITIRCDAANELVKVYPNPASDMLTINAPAGASRYVLINTHGQQLLEGSLQPGTQTLYVKKLPAGSYYLLLRFTDRTEQVPVLIRR